MGGLVWEIRRPQWRCCSFIMFVCSIPVHNEASLMQDWSLSTHTMSVRLKQDKVGLDERLIVCRFHRLSQTTRSVFKS